MGYEKKKKRDIEESDYTLGKTAEELSLHIDTVRSLVREGVINAYQVNPRAQRPSYRVTPEALQDYRQGRAGAPASATPQLSGAEMLALWEREGALGIRSDELDSPSYARRLREEAEKRT